MITGANRGIGLEFVRQYAEEGIEVIATCKRPDEAKALILLTDKFPNLSVEKLDMNSDEDLKVLRLTLEKSDIQLDILVSNAGVLLKESFGLRTRYIRMRKKM